MNDKLSNRRLTQTVRNYLLGCLSLAIALCLGPWSGTPAGADEPAPPSVVGKWVRSDVKSGDARSEFVFHKDGRAINTVYVARDFVTKTEFRWKQEGNTVHLSNPDEPRIVFTPLELSKDGSRLRSFSKDDRTKLSEYVRAK